MKREFFLRSRVARRVVGLFLFGAVGPVAILAALSYRHLSRNLEEQARGRLSRDAKSATIILLDRLASATEELRGAAPLVLPDGAGSHRRAGARWIAVWGPGGEWRPLRGPAPGTIPLALTSPVADRVAGGQAWVTTTGGGSPTVLLATRLESDTAAVLVAEIEPGRLWGAPDVNPLLPTGASGCVLGPGEVPLHSIGDGCPTSTDFETVSATATVFLGYEFGAPSWQVRVVEPRQVSLAPMAGFQVSFFWVMTLTLAVVFILANVQIRRSMEPLDALTEGTRRVAAGDLGHRVAVRADDEFKLVAASFNGMAASLDQQIGLLTSLQTLNQAALVSPTAEGVLTRSQDVLRRTFAGAVCIAARSPARSGQLWQAQLGDTATEWRASFRPAQAELDRMRGLAGPESRRGLAALDHFGALAIGAEWHVALASLTSQDELVGFLAVARPDRPFGPEELGRVNSVAGQTAVALANARLVERLDELGWGALKALARTIDANSHWTAGHSERVTAIAIRIGRAMSFSETEIDLLHRGGLLHDIGKIGVPAAVLDKPTSLTVEEWKIIQRHPVIGAEILAPLPIFAGIVPLVRWHHEALNGSGYPDRLVGDRIPFNVRVLTVADVFDALTSERPYRPAWGAEAALRTLEEGIGSRFDGDVVRTWAGIVRECSSGDWTAELPSLVTPEANPAPGGR